MGIGRVSGPGIGFRFLHPADSEAYQHTLALALVAIRTGPGQGSRRGGWLLYRIPPSIPSHAQEALAHRRVRSIGSAVHRMAVQLPGRRRPVRNLFLAVSLFLLTGAPRALEETDGIGIGRV
jgi:hypothetical protein